MSKFLKIMIVLLTIAAVAAPVFAEDRLSLSGEMRVRGWYLDDGDDYTNTFADQRLRFFGNLAVAEGVKVQFRFDATESTWGDQAGFGSGRLVTGSNNPMQWDRAYLDISKSGWGLRAGQQYLAYGISGFDAQDNGMQFTIKGAAPVSMFFMVDNNNGSDSDDFYYGAQVSHKTDAYKANAYFASQKASTEEVYVLGVNYGAKLGMIDLFAEVDYFTGDADTDVDAMGLQMILDGSVAASEMVTVGGQFAYAMGADEDEAQYVVLGNDFGGWDPLMDVGTNLSNEKMPLGRPFDLFGSNSGVIAGRVYTKIKASDAVGLGASLTYAVPESDEDWNTDADSALALALGMTYQIMANTSFHAQVQYVDVDAPDTDAFTGVGAGLYVNF
jgi:hypothetical protein